MQTIQSPVVPKVKPKKRTLSMGLYFSQPEEIEPTKNYFRADNKKQCNKCNAVLISGINISPGYLKRHSYVCRACRTLLQREYLWSLRDAAKAPRQFLNIKGSLKTAWRNFLISIMPNN